MYNWKINLRKIGVVCCAVACTFSFFSNRQISYAKAYINSWNLVDIGKHLDYDGNSSYMSYVKKGASKWNSYKSGVIRADSWKVLEDVYVSDINKANGATGVTYSTGKIELNKYYLKNSSSNEIQNTVTHELGHALGLAHSTSGNIMYYSQTSRVSLGSNDKDSYDAAYKKY